MQTGARILIVDDEPDIREMLRTLLENQQYTVCEAASGARAVELMREEPGIDLILLDIMMPGLDGIETCAEIRRFSSAPILFLTAKTLERDKSSAYTSGGDDYLPKPFSPAELLMKVDSLLRRYLVYQGKQTAAGQDTVCVGDLQIDLKKRVIRQGGEEIELTEKEMAILLFLTAHRGEVFDARTIYEQVWKEPWLPSASNTVMVHILHLRKKIEQNPTDPAFIRTIWGKGYSFE